MSEPAERGGRARTWIFVAAGLALCLGLVTGRLLWQSREALRAGEAAEARGDLATASFEYLDAARLYVPGSPFARTAYDRLAAIADRADAAGDLQNARRALEAIRAAALGTRSFYTPYADRLAAADRRLAGLYAAIEDPRLQPGASDEERAAWHAERLARHPGPRLPFVFLTLAGLAGWLASAVVFLTRGLDAGLRLRRRAAALAGLGFAVGFALFLVGLRLA